MFCLGSVGAAPLLMLVASTAVLAAPDVPSAAGEWVLEQKEQSCVIAMSSAGPRHQKLTFAVTPGQDAANGSLGGNIPRIGSRSGQTEVELILMPSSYRVTASAALTRDPDTWDEIFVYWDMPEMLIDQLAKSTGLAIESKGKRRFEVKFFSPAEAVSALRACNEMRLKSWGVDTTAMATLKRKPKPMRGTHLIDSNDYPVASAIKREQGTTVVRFTVDVDGRTKACVPVVSSGFSALDAQSCKSILARGRFEPALDAQGNKTASETVASIRWSLGH